MYTGGWGLIGRGWESSREGFNTGNSTDAPGLGALNSGSGPAAPAAACDSEGRDQPSSPFGSCDPNTEAGQPHRPRPAPSPFVPD